MGRQPEFFAVAAEEVLQGVGAGRVGGRGARRVPRLQQQGQSVGQQLPGGNDVLLGGALGGGAAGRQAAGCGAQGVGSGFWLRVWD